MLLPCLELQTSPEPQYSLIILHGLGADGEDFLPVCKALRLKDLEGGMRFVLPSAPDLPISRHNGYVMRAWYDLRPDGVLPREDEAGARASQARIDALIHREMTRGIASEHIFLMGFSQGCAMALMTGLRFPHRLGGIIALSGYLPAPDTTASERHPANAATPIFMAHGREDDVVPMARGLQARDLLRQLGSPVSWHDYPMDHTLCLDEIRAIDRWIGEQAALPQPGSI